MINTLAQEIKRIKAGLLPDNWEAEIDEDFGLSRESVLNSYTCDENLYRLGLAWELSFDGKQFQGLKKESLEFLPSELLEYVNSALATDEDGIIIRKQSIPIPKDWMPSAEDYQKLENTAKMNLLYPDELIAAIAAITLAELPDAIAARSCIGDSNRVNAGYDHW